MKYFAPGAKEGEEYAQARELQALESFLNGKLGSDDHDDVEVQ